jgi:uncharacterized repeat protein (TIGR01451 family)
MKIFHPRQHPSNVRVFIALLVSLVILVTPVVPAASGSPLRAAGFAPPSAVVTATKTDSFSDPNGDGKAEPGDTLTYDVNVSNTGAADATGVNFTDTIDPNTTLVPGSLRVSPLAFADSYNATRNIALSIAAPGVLANDTGAPSPSAQPIAAGATTQGGSVTLNADGSFNYAPPAGFQGTDTFNYTATNGLSPNDTATVTINVDEGPTVTTTSPANGATSGAQNSNITINFSESVNATASSFSVECPAGSPRTFALSASPAASFTLDPTADLPAGTTCTVTVFASQITDADAFDPPDQMAADYTFSFGLKPLAVDDMRSATGNVRINTATTGYSVLANDQAPGATITAFDPTSAQGGEVTVNTSTGTFTYNPPRGFTGTDSFNYTVGNGGGSDTGTVVLTVSDMLWFINNAAGACPSGCDGRLTNPYTSLAAFEADNGNGGANPEAGDNIFIYTGGGTYTAPVTLENNQVVVGQGATGALTGVGSLTGITPAPDSDPLPSTGGTKPSITSPGNGFDLVSNNELYGLAFDDTVGTAVNSIANVGTLVIGDVAVNNDGSNGSGIGLDDGGTVTATGVNTINTRSGVALNVTNTNIGAANLTFRSISAGNNTADADPANGIVLNNTGTAAGDGGLIVTGNGGNCTEADQTCTGGRIQNTAGADTNPVSGLPAGTGIALRNTKNVSLTRMRVHDHPNYGIHGATMSGFTLANSVVNGVNGTNASTSFRDSSVRFDQVTGTVSITNSLLTGGWQHNLLIDNQSGTATVNVNGCTIKNNSAAAGDDGFQLEAETTAVVNAFVTNNSFSAHGGDHFGLTLINSADVDLTFTGNSFAGGHAIGLGQGLFIFGSNFNGTFNYDISNNGTAAAPLVGNRQAGMINVNKGSGTGTFSGRIQNNFIGNAAIAGSGSSQSSGIIVGARGGGSHTVLIDNNIVRQYFDRGIVLEAGQGAAALNATVTNNTVDNFADAANSLHGIHSDNGSLSTDTNAVCMDIQDNLVANAGNEAAGGVDIRLRKSTALGLSVRIPGLVGTNAASATAKLAAENPTATTVTASGANYTGGAACTQPTLPAPGPSVSSIPARRDESAQAGGRLTAALLGRDGFVEVASLEGGAKYATARSMPKARAHFSSVSTKAVDGAARESGLLKTSAALRTRVVAQPFSGETVTASVGTLPAGRTVHITFQVTVDDPFPGTQVSNQGTVTADGGISVLTDDPAAGGSADPTVTPILTPPSISVKDASVAEPATGTSPAAFAVTLSHAYTHTVTVNYAAANDTGGANPAAAGSDYTSTSGTLTFNPGETVQTVSVPVLADADASETNETFLVNLSGATGGGAIADAQAVGTITPESTPGTVVISELRTSGPAGPDDDFVELYNNTDSPVTVAASDASAGWAIVKSGNDCAATPVVVAVIPNGTVIPARGNYLVTGSAYSLGAYAAGDQALVFNIEDDHNVALFNTADLSNVSTGTRLDAVGFGSNSGGNCDLLREGSTLQPAAGSASEHSFVRAVDKGATKDTNDNAADFVVVSTAAGAVGSNASSTLGAPGPENSTGARGPVPCNVPDTARFGRSRLDSTVGVGAAPNTVRNTTSDPVNNSTFGTIDFSRRFTNNTGGAVTQLRYRITNTTNPSTPGAADLRARSSATFVVSVNDPATCGGPAPCNVTVVGTTLEQPPAQTSGGGVNSTLGVGTITTATPLPAGASVNLHLLFGVQQAGDYHVSIVIETETAGSIGQDVWELRGNTETGNHSDGGCNTPPVASAGADQTIECGGGSTSVTLDGTASSDADGDSLTYEWREGASVLGTGATLNTSLPFGPHTVTLKVTDPSGDFGEDTVNVNIADTTDPMISAPPNVSVNTGPGASSCGAFVSDATLGTATASDGCSASVTVTRTGVPAGNNFPVGTTQITYKADDGHGHTKEAYQFVTVTDNTAPVISVPASVEVNAPANSCSANVDPGTATATDNCAGVTVAGVRSDAQPLNAPYPVGTTTITWTANDAHGNSASGTQTVKVNDVTPPTIVLTTNAISLGSPNHSYQTLTIAQLVASASDGCDPSVDINDVVVSQATSDEAEDVPGGGDGNTSNDIVIAPDCKSLQLRAERQGLGDGRVYKITLKVKDSSGNVATAVRTVVVQQSGPAVDSGVHYTVNGCTP